MGLYFGSMLLTVICNVGYHLSQKSIHPKLNPLLSLTLTYGVALLCTLVAIPFFRGDDALSLGQQIKLANWATYVLGIALVGLELGFLLAYRSGWKMSVAALFSNSAVTLLLIPVGLAVFRESLDARRIAGIGLASVGLWLIGGR